MQFIEVEIHIFLDFYAAGATAEIYNESLLHYFLLQRDRTIFRVVVSHKDYSLKLIVCPSLASQPLPISIIGVFLGRMKVVKSVASGWTFILGRLLP